MHHKILASFIVLLAACSPRASPEPAPRAKGASDAKDAPSPLQTASVATREPKAAAHGALAEPSPTHAKPAPAVRSLLQREGVVLAPDGSGLVLDPLGDAVGEPSEAPPRPRLFRRMPASQLQQFGEAAAP